MLITERFARVSTTRKVSGKCPACGKRVTRSRTFTMTVNPFNCVGQGVLRRPKTWREVNADVQAEANAWIPDFTHDACRGTTGDQT